MMNTQVRKVTKLDVALMRFDELLMAHVPGLNTVTVRYDRGYIHVSYVDMTRNKSGDSSHCWSGGQTINEVAKDAVRFFRRLQLDYELDHEPQFTPNAAGMTARITHRG